MKLSPRNSKIAAWVVVPFLFALVVGISYGVALSRRFAYLFPTSTYLIGLVGVALVAGVSILLIASPKPRLSTVILYTPAMLAVLLVIQGIVSCLHGDCL